MFTFVISVHLYTLKKTMCKTLTYFNSFEIVEYVKRVRCISRVIFKPYKNESKKSKYKYETPPTFKTT